MELLFGAILSLAMEFYKRMALRLGDKVAKELIYLLLFLAAVTWTILVRHNIITTEAIQYVVTVMAASIATYELILKHIGNWITKYYNK